MTAACFVESMLLAAQTEAVSEGDEATTGLPETRFVPSAGQGLRGPRRGRQSPGSCLVPFGRRASRGARSARLRHPRDDPQQDGTSRPAEVRLSLGDRHRSLLEDPFARRRSSTAPPVRPLAEPRRKAAEILGDRTHRLVPATVLALVLQHQPHRTALPFRGPLCWCRRAPTSKGLGSPMNPERLRPRSCAGSMHCTWTSARLRPLAAPLPVPPTLRGGGRRHGDVPRGKGRRLSAGGHELELPGASRLPDAPLAPHDHAVARSLRQGHRPHLNRQWFPVDRRRPRPGNRRVPSWRRSNILDSAHRLAALERSPALHGRPVYFDIVHGARSRARDTTA